MGRVRTSAILAQVREVVEDQHISLETVCMLLQVDAADLLNAFEDRVSQYADLFGVNVDLVSDLIEPSQDDIYEDEIEALLKESEK